jgi:RND family efflux transporter MFP subunit
VSAGQPVLELSGDGALEVETQLPESIAGSLAEGTGVEVRLPFSGGGEPAVVSGRLVRVGLAAATAGGLFPVRVEIEATAGLLPGMAAEVRFPVSPGEQFTVPLAAVLDPGASRPHVFKLAGGSVARTPVEVVALIGDRVGVRGELAAGDRVVTTGHTSLVDGDPVEVVP